VQEEYVGYRKQLHGAELIIEQKHWAGLDVSLFKRAIYILTSDGFLHHQTFLPSS